MGILDDLQRPVLVLGATGGQGGAVAAALIQAGRPVRALVRDPSSAGAVELAGAGAQLAVAEFTDREALTAAMRGWPRRSRSPARSSPDRCRGRARPGDHRCGRRGPVATPGVLLRRRGDRRHRRTAFREQGHSRAGAGGQQPAAYGGGAHLFLRQRPRRLPGPARRRPGTLAARGSPTAAARPQRPGLIRQAHPGRSRAVRRPPDRAGQRRADAAPDEPVPDGRAGPPRTVPRSAGLRHPQPGHGRHVGVPARRRLPGRHPGPAPRLPHGRLDLLHHVGRADVPAQWRPGHARAPAQRCVVTVLAGWPRGPGKRPWPAH